MKATVTTRIKDFIEQRVRFMTPVHKYAMLPARIVNIKHSSYIVLPVNIKGIGKKFEDGYAIKLKGKYSPMKDAVVYKKGPYLMIEGKYNKTLYGENILFLFLEAN